ncbi:hypothetical protein V5O48_014856 [Marasmius crinis-equi]|uniref:Uncharacterized protein n=1 Tax=Marasmius crinis-equi TaxID=585013 RepID=A0ABR3EW70_9AGAR
MPSAFGLPLAAGSSQSPSDLRAWVEEVVDKEDPAYTDDNVDMEDAETVDAQHTQSGPYYYDTCDPPTTHVFFNETPASFNSKGVHGANHNLPPRSYSAMPSGFLRVLGHVSRNEDGSMPAYVVALEHWQKNIDLEVLEMVQGEDGWLAAHVFDGGTLLWLANDANNDDIVQAIRSYLLGFPNLTEADLRVMVAQPCCHFLGASNKHAPPCTTFIWVQSRQVCATLIHQQTHDLSDACTFHVTPIGFDSPSYYVMNITPIIKDIP